MTFGVHLGGVGEDHVPPRPQFHRPQDLLKVLFKRLPDLLDQHPLFLLSSLQDKITHFCT